MSNGIDKNPLLDISKVYLEQIVEKKDNSYLEPDMKKRQANNEKARKEMEKVKGQKNPHFEEKKQEWDSEIVNSLADAYKEMQEEGYKGKHGQSDKQYADSRSSGGKMVSGDSKMSGAEYTHGRRVKAANPGMQPDVGGKTKPKSQGKMDAGSREDLMYRKANLERKHRIAKMAKEELDPVGQEDGDINNDGKKDKTDKYLAKRRKAIGNAIKGNMKKEETDVDKYIETVAKVKEAERKNDIQRWFQKESRSSNWRQDLSEIMTDDVDSKPIKEKNVKNKIKINPKLGEAIEEIGGTLLEEIEVDEMDFIVESVYDELIEEGYAEDDVEDAIQNAMEATVSFGHDTKELKKDGSQVGSKRRFLKRKAGEFLQKAKKKVGMASAQAQVAAYNKQREVKQAAGDKARQVKTSAKRGIKNLAQKVADRMSEETVDEEMTVTNADKKGNTPAYQAYKAGKKDKSGKPMYKAADHMKEGDGDPCWDSHKQVGMKKKGGKMVPNCVPKNEEVDHVDEKFSMAADPEKRALPRPTKKAENKKGMSARSRAVKAVGTQRRQDKETGISGEKNPRAYREETEVEEGYKELSRDKRNTMFRKAGNLSRTALQGGDKGTEAGKKSGKIVKALNKDAEKYNRNDVKEDASMSPQELQLQKKKAMVDRMIAQKRQQGLNKAKKSEAPTKAMGEEVSCDHSVKGKECPVHGKKDCSSISEEGADSLKDRRMERGGVGGNQRYNKPISNTPNTFGKKKPKYDGMSALDKVKASIRAKHGQGAIIDTKKK